MKTFDIRYENGWFFHKIFGKSGQKVVKKVLNKKSFYQILHSWAMIVLWGFFLNNIFFIFSIFLFLLFLFLFICLFFVYFFFRHFIFVKNLVANATGSNLDKTLSNFLSNRETLHWQLTFCKSEERLALYCNTMTSVYTTGKQ